MPPGMRQRDVMSLIKQSAPLLSMEAYEEDDRPLAAAIEAAGRDEACVWHRVPPPPDPPTALPPLTATHRASMHCRHRWSRPPVVPVLLHLPYASRPAGTCQMIPKSSKCCPSDSWAKGEAVAP